MVTVADDVALDADDEVTAGRRGLAGTVLVTKPDGALDPAAPGARAPRERGVVVERAWAGTFLSSIDMAGVSVAVMGLDDERLALLDAPAESAAWPSGSGVVTETMAPRRGRSSYLADRVHGHRDAGAEGVVVWLAAMSEKSRC
jgi:triose/dihydroxyacetone kinase / FAD-AMP lyase (cyclizing)